MFFVKKLTNSIKNSYTLWRSFCNVISEELTVQTFCDVHVDVPYNVRVKPLDVHKYHNCGTLKLELLGAGGRNSVKHIQDGNNIKIFAPARDYDQEVTCFIHAPVKANLNITACGNIHAGVFGGSKLILKSRKGNIFTKKFQGETIDLNTENGDITLAGAIVASNISAVVANTGCIKTKRIQGMNATLKTNQGNITVDSSYCDKGLFEADSGDLNLQNIHKHSEVILRKGKLNLSGLDGQLEAKLQNTVAEIQLSQVLEDSKILMSGEGEIKLLISEECQENTLFEIASLKHTLEPSVKLVPSQNDTVLYLTPMNLGNKCKTVYVECKNGSVHVGSASWINMLRLNANK